MAEITASLVRKLREETGVGMMSCKKALQEAAGDFEKAVVILRKSGEAKAAKRADKSANQGMVASYVHLGGKIATLLELNCETDFVARNEDFQTLAHDLAMQVAATNPTYLRPEDVPSAVVEKEKEIYAAQLKTEGKPVAAIEKILPGKLEKFYAEHCLLKQPFVKDSALSVEEKINELVTKIGEKIQIGRFVRFAIAG